MKRPLYLVTGATGVTGGYAVDSLRSADCEVRAFVPREDERSEALKRRGVELSVGDINDFVRQITGRAPLSIEEFVSKHRAVLVAAA